MENFVYHNPAKIIFGKGVENEVGKEAARYGSRVLLHYGGGSIKRSGLYDRVMKSLRDAGLYVVELGGVVPNPRLSLVRQGIELCRNEKIDLILAVGGGSVIDSSKAIAMGVRNEGDVWEHFMGGKPLTDSMPVGVVLTIPAAGSESSDSCVITNEDGWYKRGVNSPWNIPKFAVMNPELTYTLPPYQTACGISDIIAHMMERYFTQVKDVDFTDRLIEGAIRSMLYNAPIVMRDPENYAARSQIMWTGSIAHNNLLSTGRIGDWASHKMEHELSGIYDIAHGAGLSIIFPAWMKYVYRDNIDRFVQFAVRIFDVDYSFDDKDRIVMEGIRRLEAFYRSLDLPTRLSDAGIGSDRLEEMAKKTQVGLPSIGQFKKLHAEDVLEIYKLACDRSQGNNEKEAADQWQPLQSSRSGHRRMGGR